MLHVRPAIIEDIPAIMQVLVEGREIMRKSGNPNQWPAGYPTEDMVRADILSGYGTVVEEDAAVVGYFACIPSPDPTYAYIEDGSWLDDEKPYYVIHRIAKRKQAHGVFAAMLDYVGGITGNIRIDTHRENRIMQHLLQKYGFRYCGIIYLVNGVPRLAYQRIR